MTPPLKVSQLGALGYEQFKFNAAFTHPRASPARNQASPLSIHVRVHRLVPVTHCRRPTGLPHCVLSRRFLSGDCDYQGSNGGHSFGLLWKDQGLQELTIHLDRTLCQPRPTRTRLDPTFLFVSACSSGSMSRCIARDRIASGSRSTLGIPGDWYNAQPAGRCCVASGMLHSFFFDSKIWTLLANSGRYSRYVHMYTAT